MADRREMISSDIAALFVSRNGPYYDMGLDCYDVERDAMTFNQDKPAIMHPPCAKWSILSYCRPELRENIGKDDGMFAFCLQVLQRCGGVIEHPARSLAWDHFNLPIPIRYGWTTSLFSPFATTEIYQSVYGHDAAKRTWLVMRKGDRLPQLDWSVDHGKTTVDMMPKRLRHITPRPFAQALVDAVRGSAGR